MPTHIVNNKLSRHRLPRFGLILCLALLPVEGRGQPAKTALQEVPANIETMGKGGLFFPGATADTVLPGQQVAAEVEISVSGMVARTMVTQHFANPREDWVEALYVFPLPETAAVDRLRLTIGDRVIEGAIAEREEAQRQFEEARDAGKTASLLSQERPNIFTNAVTNIAPGETVTVQIGFEQPVDYHYDEQAGPRFSIRFPMAIMPRYMPGQPLAALQVNYTDTGNGWAFDTDQVADASRISPPVNAHDEVKVNPLSLTVDLAAGFPLDVIDSSYHSITTKAAEDHYKLELAEGVVPADRDFELVWRPLPGAAPATGLFSENHDGFDHHLVMISPPKPDGSAVEIVEPQPRDITFILDRSGSMSGQPIRQAKAALENALKRLSNRDRFDIIAFSSGYTTLFGEPRPAMGGNIDDAMDWLGRIEAGGGTEMAAALRHALTGDEESQGRLRQIVFITDGAVGNENALFGMINRKLGDRRLFTVGIGSAPNGFFMREAATAGRGTFTFIGQSDEVTAKMTELFRQLAEPVLTDIDLDLPRGAEIYPPLIPDLYAGEPVSFVLRLPEGTNGQVGVSAMHQGTAFAESIQIAGLETDEGRDGVAALWARHKIREIERVGRRQSGGASESIRDDIVQVALSYDLLSQQTSLVAIDSVARRPAEAQLASGSVATNMPHGATMQPPAQAAAASASTSTTVTPIAAPTNPFAANALPQTATPAALLWLFGLLLSIGGMVSLWWRRLTKMLHPKGAA
ncbi:MAG: marine proteobacterial sortase target protein [Alphaproteobacteria bacterium]|nr:marine proteobacterial sortase target protein [Alphaproteobacteria bacterium SS10]